MIRLSSRSVALSLGLAVFAVANAAQAQRPPQQGPRPMPLDATGTVQGMQGNLLKIDYGGVPWVIQVQPKTEIHVLGTADASFLQPGMFVSFQAELDKKGNATSPVSELQIITPRDQFSLGIIPQSEESTFEAEESGETKKGPPPQTGTYKVGGRIVSLRNGKMQVNANGQQVKADLAESPTITVDVATPSVASLGDKITLKGNYVQEGRGIATDIEITLSNPLTAPEPKKGRGGRGARTPRGAPEAGAADGAKTDEAKADPAAEK